VNKLTKYTLSLIRYRPWLFLSNIVLWGGFHLMPVAGGVVIRAILDQLAGPVPAGANLWILVAVYAGIELGRFLCFSRGFDIFIEFWFILETLLRKNLLEWVLTAKGPRVFDESSGAAVTRFRDDVGEVTHWFEVLEDMLGIVVFAIVALAIMFSIHAKMTLVVLAPLVAMVYGGMRMSEVIRRYRRANREATSRVTGFIGEVFGAAQAVKVASAEDAVTRHFRDLNEVRRKAAVKDSMITELYYALTGNLIDITISIVLFLGASAMTVGEFTVGDFALFVTYLSRMTWYLRYFGNMIAQHRRVGVSFDRLDTFLRDAPEGQIVKHGPIYVQEDMPPVPDPRFASRAVLDRLEVRGLTCRYPGTDRGVEDVTFDVAKGELVVITGRIGAGKTTLLRGMLGLLPVDGGAVVWNGQPVEDPATFFVPPVSAYTAQVPRLFSETLRDNILSGVQATEEELAAAIRRAVLEPDIAELDHGLATPVGNRGVKLSGGQVQRAAAARMFVREPQLMVFDDLSSALDVETERLLWERMEEVQGATCLVVSHRREVLRRAHKIIVLKDGHVDGVGTLEELLANNEEMGALYHAYDTVSEEGLSAYTASQADVPLAEPAPVAGNR